jgi:hypothetical protein
MTIIIQCAATKRPDAGYLMSAAGRPVVFVADPESAPPDDAVLYARPDDTSPSGKSWRDVLLEYNKTAGDNALGLYPAYRLYQNRIYSQLVERFSQPNVYILSAGWGLIRADFLTPYYDITFSQSAERYKRRKKQDLYYRDFRMLPDVMGEEIIFFGGKDYIPLLCALTDNVTTPKTMFYNSERAPLADGWTAKRFETSTRTNWHYECAAALLKRIAAGTTWPVSL